MKSLLSFNKCEKCTYFQSQKIALKVCNKNYDTFKLYIGKCRLFHYPIYVNSKSPCSNSYFTNKIDTFLE